MKKNNNNFSKIKSFRLLSLSTFFCVPALALLSCGGELLEIKDNNLFLNIKNSDFLDSFIFTGTSGSAEYEFNPDNVVEHARIEIPTDEDLKNNNMLDKKIENKNLSNLMQIPIKIIPKSGYKVENEIFLYTITNIPESNAMGLDFSNPNFIEGNFNYNGIINNENILSLKDFDYNDFNFWKQASTNFSDQLIKYFDDWKVKNLDDPENSELASRIDANQSLKFKLSVKEYDLLAPKKIVAPSAELVNNIFSMSNNNNNLESFNSSMEIYNQKEIITDEKIEKIENKILENSYHYGIDYIPGITPIEDKNKYFEITEISGGFNIDVTSSEPGILYENKAYIISQIKEVLGDQSIDIKINVYEEIPNFNVRMSGESGSGTMSPYGSYITKGLPSAPNVGWNVSIKRRGQERFIDDKRTIDLINDLQNGDQVKFDIVSLYGDKYEINGPKSATYVYKSPVTVDESEGDNSDGSIDSGEEVITDEEEKVVELAEIKLDKGIVEYSSKELKELFFKSMVIDKFDLNDKDKYPNYDDTRFITYPQKYTDVFNWFKKYICEKKILGENFKLSKTNFEFKLGKPDPSNPGEWLDVDPSREDARYYLSVLQEAPYNMQYEYTFLDRTSVDENGNHLDEVITTKDIPYNLAIDDSISINLIINPTLSDEEINGYYIPLSLSPPFNSIQFNVIYFEYKKVVLVNIWGMAGKIIYLKNATGAPE